MENVPTNNYPYLTRLIEYIPMCMAVFAARDLRLLEANPLYLNTVEPYLEPCWQHGAIIGNSLTAWGKWSNVNGLVDIFRQVVSSGKPCVINEYALRTSAANSYWHITLKPIYDGEGELVYVLQTLGNTAPLSQDQQYTEKAKGVAEREHERQEIVETVARSVRESLDARYIGTIAVDALYDNFQPFGVLLHIDAPLQQGLQLLYSHMSKSAEHFLGRLNAVSYTSEFLFAQSPLRRDALIIEDLQVAAAAGQVPQDHVLVRDGLRGYFCVPLWFGDQFEGALTATFAQAIDTYGPEVRTFLDCSTHIAAALAQARLHEAIAHERTRLSAILNQLPEGILLIEAASSSVSYANSTAASLLGIPLSDLVNMVLHQHIFAQVTSDLDVTIGHPFPWNFLVIRALSGETVRSQETLVTQPSGSTSVVLASSAPLCEKNGTITGALIVFQDITSQKTLEHQKNEFFWMANHELRTPITIIQGFAELLHLKGEQDSYLDDAAKRALIYIQEQSEYLTILIEEMLNFSLIEQGRFTLQRTQQDLVQMIKHIIDNQGITTRTHHISLVMDGLPVVPLLVGQFDERRLIQVINNLIGNAIKYSPAGGEIEVGLRYTEAQPYQALIWVKDQGIGIAESELPHLFTRFYRSNMLDPAISGLGIGLFLAKEVVTGHGGHIWVESTPGQGSTFYILLPLN